MSWYTSDPLYPTIFHLSHTVTALLKELCHAFRNRELKLHKLCLKLLAGYRLLIFVEVTSKGDLRPGLYHRLFGSQILLKEPLGVRDMGQHLTGHVVLDALLPLDDFRILSLLVV